MNDFIAVHAHGSEIMLNLSQVKYLSRNYGDVNAIVYFYDGKWLELEESYDEVKHKIWR